METHANKIDEHCDRLTALEDKVGAILVKIAVPVFIMSVVGVVLGGLIVTLLTRALK